MSTITKTIGTNSRDYSTIIAWEEDLDNGAIYASGDIAKGVLCDDEVLGSNITINGGGTVGLSQIILTAPPGSRHNGKSGSGVAVTATGRRTISVSTTTVPVIIEWIEFNGNGVANVALAANAADVTIRNNLFVDQYSNVTSNPIQVASSSVLCRIYNNIIYNVAHGTGGGNAGGIVVDALAGGNATHVYNNTIYNVTAGTNTAYGIRRNNGAVYAKNNIVLDCDTACLFGTFTEDDYNLVSDTSSGGSNSIESVAAVDQFVDITGGSEDLHLIDTSDAVGAGADLSAYFTEDIDGDIRSAWDIGADEWRPESQTVTVPVIAPDAAVTSPTVTPGAIALTVPAIAPSVTVSSPTVVASAPQTVEVPAIAPATSVISPTVSAGAISLTIPAITPDSSISTPSLTAGAISKEMPTIASSATVAAPTITVGASSVTVPQIAPATSVTAPGVIRRLPVSTIAPATVVSAPSVVAGAVSITVPQIATGSTVTAPSVGQRISVPVIAPGVVVTAPTVTPGASTVTVPAISTESAVTPPALVPGEVTFTVPVVAASSSVTAPALSPGAVSLTAPTIATASTLTAPALSPGAVTLTVPLISTSVVVTAPDLVPGVATLTAPLISTVSTVTAPSVGQRQSVPLISTVSTVTSPKVNQSMYVPVIVPRLGFRRVLITNNGVTDPARTRPSIDAVILDRRTTAVKLRSR